MPTIIPHIARFSAALALVLVAGHSQAQPAGPTAAAGAQAPAPIRVQAPTPVVGTPQARAASASLPDVIQALVQTGLRFERRFPAPGGMTGWVLVQGPGEHFIVYTPADHSVAIAGTMVDAAGANLTEAHSREHAPRIDYNQAWERLERSHFVVEGARGRDVRSTIYVFKDPNCTFCNLAHIALEPYTRAGLQVRWIPVAFLRPDSFGKSAFLLEHADSDVAVDRVNESFGRSDPTVVIPVSAPTRARIEANNRLMQELGFRGTPAVVYRDRRGQAHAIPGMFRLSQLPEITGLPQKPQTDPRLERFR